MTVVRLAGRLMAAAAGAGGAPAPFVRFTTTGATFTPTVECPTGTVTWLVEETSYSTTGLSPTIDFGSSGTRHVRMSVVGGSGLAGITTINLGFNNAQDAGRYQLSVSYNKAATGCSAVEDVNLCTGLVRFLAADGDLAGVLDFTGCADLQYVECYYAYVTTTILTGCTSLIRLCLEHNNVGTLDLSPVAGNLFDLRAAWMRDEDLTLVTGSQVFANLYHLCIRHNALTGMPAASQLPVVEEMWIFGCGLSGALVIDSTASTSLLAYGQSGLTSLAITEPVTAGRNAELDVSECSLASADLTDCVGLTTIDLRDNLLDAAAVDGVLAEVESWGTSGAYTLNLSSNAAPTSAGVANAAALTGRGWTVTVTPSGGGVDSDDFERADCTGLANVGNGWYAWNNATGNIVSGALVRPDTSSYRQVLNPAASSLPADYSPTMTIPHATVGTWFGLTGRWNGTTGVRALWTAGSTALTVGDADGFQSNNVQVHTDDGYPASWAAGPGPHVVTMHMSGTTITIEIDGQTVCHATVTTNATATGTAYGICGEGQSRAWNSLGVTIP